LTDARPREEVRKAEDAWNTQPRTASARGSVRVAR
jgi:hypothetical protein